MAKYTEAQARAVRKYDSKTYKTYGLRLRKVDDAEIIESIEEAKRQGRPIREWLNGIFKAGRG